MHMCINILFVVTWQSMLPAWPSISDFGTSSPPCAVSALEAFTSCAGDAAYPLTQQRDVWFLIILVCLAISVSINCCCCFTHGAVVTYAVASRYTLAVEVSNGSAMAREAGFESRGRISVHSGQRRRGGAVGGLRRAADGGDPQDGDSAIDPYWD